LRIAFHWKKRRRKRENTISALHLHNEKRRKKIAREITERNHRRIKKRVKILEIAPNKRCTRKFTRLRS